MIDIIAVVISICALAASLYIGVNQVKISQTQLEFQDKVELYLLHGPITLRKIDGTTPDEMRPGIFIRNVGNSVIYLEKYTFNGREYPLNREVLPPVSSYDGFHYIYLPMDGTTHVSLSIDFYDWKKRHWQTKGYADFRNGLWEISYTPCERQ